MAKFARAEIRKIIGESCTDEMETALIALHHSIVDDVKDQLDAAKADAAKHMENAMQSVSSSAIVFFIFFLLFWNILFVLSPFRPEYHRVQPSIRWQAA